MHRLYLRNNVSNVQSNYTVNQTRQLSYRKEDRAMRPIYGCPEKFWESSLRTRLLFQKIVIDLFQSILRMCVQKLKFVALPVPEIIGGTQKNLGSPWIRPRSIFSQNFKGLLFEWTLWIYLPNLKLAALSVPEIIGGTKKFGAVPGYAHAPFSPKILKDFCSDGPCEYTCQIWSS